MSNKQEAAYGPIPDGPGAEVEELWAEVERWRVAHSEVCSVAQKRLNRAEAAEAERRSAVAEVERLTTLLNTMDHFADVAEVCERKANEHFARAEAAEAEVERLREIVNAQKQHYTCGPFSPRHSTGRHANALLHLNRELTDRAEAAEARLADASAVWTAWLSHGVPEVRQFHDALRPFLEARAAEVTPPAEQRASCGARVCSADYTHGPHTHRDGVLHLSAEPKRAEGGA